MFALKQGVIIFADGQVLLVEKWEWVAKLSG